MVGNRAAADAGEDEVKVKIGDKSQKGKNGPRCQETRRSSVVNANRLEKVYPLDGSVK
jgi:hypothetical protein